MLAAAVSGCADRPGGPAAATPRPNVLVYLVDTLRADHLGCYGHSRPVSPSIDALAAEGVVFENAVAHSSWTRPTVGSVLTGLTPLEHGVRDVDNRLAEELQTLPEILAAAGWDTAGFSTNPHVSEQTGFTQGFAAFEYFPRDAGAESLTRRVLAWLDGAPRSGKPWMVYAHALDPHAPYTPPADLRSQFAGEVSRPDAGSRADIKATLRLSAPLRGERVRELAALYDAEIANTDRHFGRLLDGLRARGQFEPTLIVLVADHGEGFDEHGRLAHGNSLYAELLNIPLIVKPPARQAPRREPELARQIDIVPTVLAAVSLPPPRGLSGRDLLSREPPPSPPLAVVDLWFDNLRGAGLVTSDWKVIAPLNELFGTRRELFSRRNDRLDLHELGGREPSHLGAMLRRLETELGRPGRRAPRADLDREAEESLRALGYL